MQKLLNKIICGDCIEVLGKVRKPFADLIFADPPFNIGYKYDKYHDKQEKDSYVGWTEKWMAECKRVLKPDGSLYVAMCDEYAANVKVIADELGLFLRLLNGQVGNLALLNVKLFAVELAQVRLGLGGQILEVVRHLFLLLAQIVIVIDQRLRLALRGQLAALCRSLLLANGRLPRHVFAVARCTFFRLISTQKKT